MKRKTTKELVATDIRLTGTLKEIQNKIKKLSNTYEGNLFIQAGEYSRYNCICGDYGYGYNLYRTIKESDEDFEKRKKAYEKGAQTRKVNKIKREKAKEEKERKLLAALKDKYEKESKNA